MRSCAGKRHGQAPGIISTVEWASCLRTPLGEVWSDFAASESLGDAKWDFPLPWPSHLSHSRNTARSRLPSSPLPPGPLRRVGASADPQLEGLVQCNTSSACK